MPLEPAVCLQRGSGQAVGREPSAPNSGPQTRTHGPQAWVSISAMPLAPV